MRPSLLHLGRSMTPLVVTRRTPVPSGCTIQMSASDARVDTNAIHWPSRDHAGVLSTDVQSSRRRALSPPVGATYRSKFPPRFDTNATCLPSGEMDGSNSSAGPPATSDDGPPAVATVRMSAFTPSFDMYAI